MTRQEITLPDMGEGVEAATVVGVLVKIGDDVAAEQSIVELETDKAVAEVPSPVAGKVVEIHVQQDQEVALGAALVTLEVAEAEAKSEADKKADKKTDEKPAPAKKESGATEQAEQKAEKGKGKGKAAPPVPAPPKSSPKAASPADRDDTVSAVASGTDDNAVVTSTSNVPAAPAIHKLAAELGVDLNSVSGSAAGGWITEDDVKAAARQAAGVDSAGIMTDRWGVIRRERMTQIRKTIAAKMHESHSIAVQVTNFDDADITDLEKFRQEHKHDFAAEGIELSMLPLVVHAVVNALKSHPVINASLDHENGEIIYKQYINIGIAVDTERGLVVPVLRNADHLSVAETALAMRALITRVRSGSFDVSDLRGGSFTVSNLGSVGGKYSTPIINHPESAILLTGRSGDVPAVRDGKIVVRRMMPLSLSYDHQIIDGAEAARFLTEVKSFLESPARLLAR